MDVSYAPDMNCAYVFGDRVEAFQCDAEFPCGFCTLPQNRIFYLKGLCSDDIQNLYDVEYYVHEVKNRRPYFR